MKKIIFLSFFLCFSVQASDRCEVSNPVCIVAITHMNGSQQTLKNFYISSLEQLNDDYSAVILNDNGPLDRSGLFIVDTKMNHYLTLDILPSHRGHDYFYQIISHGEKHVIIKGTGGYGFSVEGEVKYEIDFQNKKALKYKLETVHVISTRQDGEYLYFNLSGKGLKNKTIRFHKKGGENNFLYFYFVELSEEEKNQFKQIKRYTRSEEQSENFNGKTYYVNKKGVGNHRIPQPGIEAFKKYRANDVNIGFFEEGHGSFENEIGPHITINNNVYFGISFYDGEGITGVGGIGIFNLKNNKYEIHYIEEIANKSIDKMFFYEDELWCTLYQGGEGAEYHHGVMKYNISDKKYQVYDVPGEVDVVVPWKDSVFVNTSKGFYQIKDGIKKGFFRVNSKGDYELVF